MDQLHVDLWIDGQNVLCDAGTYSYASQEGRQFVSNGSHNTAVVENRSQMNSRGPFMIYDWTERRLVKCENNTFEGTIYSPNGYTHNRKVKLCDRVCEITDTVDRDCSVVFHTPCDVEIEKEKAILRAEGRIVCTIEGSAPMAVEPSERSVYYLKKSPSTCLCIHAAAGESITTSISF